MAIIIRTTINADFDGNILSANQEQLKDDEAGTIEETYLTALSRCQACGKPLEKVNEIRGRCINCGRFCCYICVGFCSICNRGPICGSCRDGFPEKGLSVCSNCLPALKKRLVHQDQLLEKKAAFERTIAVYNAQIKLVQLFQQVFFRR